MEASIASSKSVDTFRSQHKDSRKRDIAAVADWTLALIVTGGGREGKQAPVVVVALDDDVVVVALDDGVLGGNTDQTVAD